VTIPAGATSTTLTVVPMDDDKVEGEETIVLKIASDSTYVVGSPDSATVTIGDNDQPPPPPEKPTVTVVATDANAAEADRDAGSFSIRRTGSAESALRVNYTFSGRAVNGTDYERLSGSVTIASGADSATIVVRPVDDTETEGAENVVLTIASDGSYNVGSPGSATVRIADDDQPPPEKPVVSVTANDLLASEPGTDSARLTISRTGNAAAALTVHYALGGTAQNGTDYQAMSGAATIPAGAVSVDVVVRPIDDSMIEVTEVVVLTLSPDNAYNIGLLNTATVTILDDDLLILVPSGSP